MLASNSFIVQWIDNETKHIDMIASWENLMSSYEALGFCDQIDDSTRLDEFKWIVKEINKFLTRMRKVIGSANTIGEAMSSLSSCMEPGANVTIDSRKAVVFQKMKQAWIRKAMSTLESINDYMEKEEREDV